MSTSIVEVIYGKHRKYEVIRRSQFFGVIYLVRTSEGKYSGTFSRLDQAVRWAQEQASKY